jgi:non-heme chloroperoxidase
MSLEADELGTRGNPLVLLLHGGGQTRHSWKNLASRLAASAYHVVAYDARGHGESDWSAAGHYQLDFMADDLSAVIEHFGGEPVALVGASMGGAVSLIAVGERKLNASALVLVDVVARMNPDGVERIHAFMDARPDGFGGLEEVADAIAAYRPHRPRPTDLAGLSKNVRMRDDGRLTWHWDPRIRVDNGDIGSRLERCALSVGSPTLLVRGELSDLLTDDSVTTLLGLIPGSRYEVVAGAAHMVAGDQNDDFAAVVAAFLSEVVPAPSE